MATVETGARLHFGFQNLSLAHERLYGGIGVALAEPRLIVEAQRNPDPAVEPLVSEREVLEAEVQPRPGLDGRHGRPCGPAAINVWDTGKSRRRQC